jgi:hypothetical protein
MTEPTEQRRTKPVATLRERLSDQAQKTRAELVRMWPGDGRDALIGKIRAIEAAIFFNEMLAAPKFK